MEWKVGDWVVFDLRIGQVKELRENGGASFTDGCIETSSLQLADRFRPLTLRNKVIVEDFDRYYRDLRQIDGEAGFNYPDIHAYFSNLALEAIDGDNDTIEDHYHAAREFVDAARSYKPVIGGVRLFRRKRA